MVSSREIRHRHRAFEVLPHESDGVAPAQQRVRERRRPTDISANTFVLVSVSGS